MAGLMLGFGFPLAAAAPVEIHPAGTDVPANLLRIELRFARPQPLPFDVGRLSLVDAGSGLPIEAALLDLAPASPDARRITVLMGPRTRETGRRPQRGRWPGAAAGQPVRLRVDATPGGRPVALKQWQVVGARERPLDPGDWRLETPRAGGRDPLVLAFGSAISSTGERLIAVLDAAGRRLPGRAELTAGDTVWRFRPARRWQQQAYTLVTHPDLEDPAGNRVCAAFEATGASRADCTHGQRIAFRPR